MTRPEPASVGPYRPVLRMRWEDLTFLSWRADPDVAAALLPAGLTVDVADGSAWVSLVPFQMADITVAGLRVPFGTFPETNVRTYVIGPDGRPGVHFHSLDIPHVAPTVLARTLFHLPYCLARMSIDRTGQTFTYRTRRTWPRPDGPDVSSLVTVRVGDAVGRGDPLDTFLTDRDALYTTGPGGRIVKVDVRHRPWQLAHAAVEQLDDQLVAAAGWPVTGHPPDHVRHAAGITVTTSGPHRPGRR